MNMKNLKDQNQFVLEEKEKENKGFCEEKKNNRGSKVRSSCIIKKSFNLFILKKIYGRRKRVEKIISKNEYTCEGCLV